MAFHLLDKVAVHNDLLEQGLELEEPASVVVGALALELVMVQEWAVGQVEKEELAHHSQLDMKVGHLQFRICCRLAESE